jgi:hypothetical protein
MHGPAADSAVNCAYKLSVLGLKGCRVASFRCRFKATEEGANAGDQTTILLTLSLSALVALTL